MKEAEIPPPSFILIFKRLLLAWFYTIIKNSSQSYFLRHMAPLGPCLEF